jgi:hypothetical protein
MSINIKIVVTSQRSNDPQSTLNIRTARLVLHIQKHIVDRVVAKEEEKDEQIAEEESNKVSSEKPSDVRKR